MIIGDYDVDGCLSTSLMVKFLDFYKSKFKIIFQIKFKDGYGADLNLIKRLINKYNPKLVIFLDCGSSSNSAIKYIQKEKVNIL